MCCKYFNDNNDFVFDFNCFSIQDLKEKNCCQIPKEKGIYVVDIPNNFLVNFTIESTAHKIINEKNMIYPINQLENIYKNTDRKRLYIGKANGKNGLRERISCFIKYGERKRKNHTGGRSIWQINENNKLLIGYFICENPEFLEKEMIRRYKNMYGVYPLANRRL